MVLVLGLVVACGLVLASVYPGLLAHVRILATFLLPVWLPALGIGGAICLFVKRSRSRAARQNPIGQDANQAKGVTATSRWPIAGWRWIILAVAMGLSFAIVYTDAPRRMAFSLSRPGFEALAPSAPDAAREEEGVLSEWIGMYHVDRYAADARDGIYFRTHQRQEGPTTVSYGFAFQPNEQGSPFGSSRYRYMHLVGDWYSFEASNEPNEE